MDNMLNKPSFLPIVLGSSMAFASGALLAEFSAEPLVEDLTNEQAFSI